MQNIDWTKLCEGCGGCCGIVPFSTRMFERDKSKMVRKPVTLVYTKDKNNKSLIIPYTSSLTCVFLDKNKRCVVYNERPFVCRDFGNIKELPCPKLKS